MGPWNSTARAGAYVAETMARQGDDLKQTLRSTWFDETRPLTI